MLAELLLRFNHFLYKRRILFFLVFTLLLGTLIFGVTQLRISESIFSTLPKGKAFDEFNQLITSKNISNQVLFALTVPEDQELETVADTVAAFTRALTTNFDALLTDITAFREESQQDLYHYSYTHFPELIDSSYYTGIEHKIRPDSVVVALHAARERLASPEGHFLQEFLLNDPLGVTVPYFQSLGRQYRSDGTDVREGLVFINDHRQVLVTAGTRFDLGNSRQNTALFHQMEAFKTTWNNAHPEYTFNYFGTFAITAQNAIQIKQDAMLTLVLALSLILALLWACYREPLVPLYILMPAAFGGLFALGILGFLKPQVSGIALATGAVLLGIALDYSIHFFTHFRHVRSISQTLKDISAPLLTGSLTTILAYSALNFANSEILKDFGLFAGLALSGALFFTLTFLPAFLRITGFSYDGLPEQKPFFRLPVLPQRYGLPFLAGIGMLTVVFYFFSQQITFDGELENMSLHSPELVAAEKQLTHINPEKEGRIYVFASAPSHDDAATANLLIYDELVRLQQAGKVKLFTSIAPFALPDSIRETRKARWYRFWQEQGRSSRVTHTITRTGDELGFSGSAFTGFSEWMRKGLPYEGPEPDTLLKRLGLDNLIDRQPDQTTFITTLVANKEDLNLIKASLRPIPGAELFHRSEMAESLLEIVKADFNYILLISASIVFLALLLLYGRIELALLSFLPMAISWIWILGLAALLDIPFNFVNVVFATFIFGLGDDFSIFMTDGLLQRYKYGENNLSSYKSAISLSGVTVLIGTGVLLFASHPALRSIAVVSVPGIICIVFISLLFQPVLFGLFVQNRVDKGRTPISLWVFVKSWINFLFFACMCYLAFVVMLLLIILPVRTKTKKKWITRTLSKLSAAVMYAGSQIRKRTYGRENLDLDRPAVIIVNHSSFLDTMIVLMHHPRAVIMVKEWVYKSPLYGWVIRYANYLFIEEGPEANLDQARALVRDGYSIFVFPEGTRSEDGRIHRFHKGAFFLAGQLGLPVQPFLIHGAGYVSPKHELMIKPGPVNVKILPRILPDDLQWGVSFQERAKNISRYFKDSFAVFKKEMDDTTFLKQRIFNNYLYKGPVLEWYFKIKWELEKRNYEAYDRLIGDRKYLTDLGCGYGFMAFYLHYREEEKRCITAVDYDDQKIRIAANCYGKNENLQFIQSDITTYPIVRQDVFFLNDVLHYLPKDQQVSLLGKCIRHLNDNGLLFIRDGITDQHEKHKATRFTEVLSTRLLGFNKKSGALHFFSSQDIKAIADAHGLDFEVQSHSKNTSNVLFILRKPAGSHSQVTPSIL